MPNGSASCSTAKPPSATSGDCGPDCVTPGCATRLPSRTSTAAPPVALDRALFQAMIAGRWIDEAQNLIVEGPAGVGKSWLACALGQKACRDNRSVLYQRVPRMLSDLALARGDGRYPRLMRALGGVKLLILDDWGLEPLGPEQRHDILEIVEDRYGRGATLITSQIPVDRWHDLIGEPTLADAILDRIVHNAHRLQLKGDSLRKQKAPRIAAA